MCLCLYGPPVQRCLPLSPFLMCQQFLLSSKVLCHVSGGASILDEKRVEHCIFFFKVSHVASSTLPYCCSQRSTFLQNTDKMLPFWYLLHCIHFSSMTIPLKYHLVPLKTKKSYELCFFTENTTPETKYLLTTVCIIAIVIAS